MERLMSLLGLFIMLAIALGLSTDRKKVKWKTIISGVGLQLFLGVIILKTGFGRSIFEGAKEFFNNLLGFSNQGGDFIFGGIADVSKVGFVFATMALPAIIFISSLMSVLYYIGVMQWVIKAFAWSMVRIMGTSGAESLATAANVFAGQTEAPLVVRPFIAKMTKSELMAMMTGGMATVAGGVLAAYVGMGIDAGHLLAASVMSAPAALVCAKLLVPETEIPVTRGTVKMDVGKTHVNIIQAAASGAADGLQLALNVAGMLLAFIALIALVNAGFSWFGGLFGFPQLSMELICGYIFSPISFLMGVPWEDSFAVGALIGKKTILNEFVAYVDLQNLKDTISPRSFTIATYALCGFSNFSSIAIQLGGIGPLAPERKGDLAKLGLRSMIGGTLACLMTACVAGLFL